MDNSETPGERLRARRKECGLSAADLARRVGRSQAATRNHENGTNGIPAGIAAQYACELGVTPEWILFGAQIGGAAASPRRSPVSLTKLPNGEAHLQIDAELPFSVALQILALVQGDGK